MAATPEGEFQSNGGWRAGIGTGFRDLTRQEVEELKRMAEDTTPSFEGPHNIPFEKHHPIAREIWARRGIPGAK